VKNIERAPKWNATLTVICSLLLKLMYDWRLISAFALVAVMMIPGVVVAQTKSSLASGRLRPVRAFTDDSLEAMLIARGLGSNLGGNAAMIAPPSGTEIEETEEKAKQDGQTISKTRAWTEEVNNNSLHVELTSFPSRQFQVAFWVLPNHAAGCLIFGRTMYDTNGRSLVSEFWRNDRQLKITGGADFPPDLYPEALPAIALTRVVDVSHRGASGKIDQQVSPYGFVDQQVTVGESNQVQVPAGRFAAVRIDSQPNASSILPTWPRFTLGAVSPFLPQTTYFFQADPPHRLLRKEQAGTPLIGGPEGVTELVRYYNAGDDGE
jgi:hypothetical protein